MAELVEELPGSTTAAWTVARPRISWGAIFGGAVSAFGVWSLLFAFGLAVGLSTLDAGDPGGSLRTSGIFAGVWGVVAPLIALFVGGVVAGRLSGALGRGGGAAHGLVMWGLATIVAAYLAAVALSALAGAAATVGRSVVQAGGAAAGLAARGAARGAPGTTFGIDADDALAPVNRRLQAEGKPTVTADELQGSARDVVQAAIRDGRFDRATLVSALARNTKLSRVDAEEIASRVEDQWEHARAQLQGAAAQAQDKALAAAKTSGKAFWGLFGALLLGLVAAIAGGAAGAGSFTRRRRERREPAPITPA